MLNKIDKIKNSVRPAWIEIDLSQLRRNLEIISRDQSDNLKFISVIKDQAYGHGAIEIGKISLEFGATHLAVATIDEALELRKARIKAPVMIFGERTEEEFRL